MTQKLVQNADGEFEWVDASKARKAPPLAVDKPVIGEALGCIGTQVDEMREAARREGLTDIEYVPTDVEGWYDCRASNANSMAKWSKVCGLGEKNGQFSGRTISAEELAAAEKWTKERYPDKVSK